MRSAAHGASRTRACCTNAALEMAARRDFSNSEIRIQQYSRDAYATALELAVASFLELPYSPGHRARHSLQAKPAGLFRPGIASGAAPGRRALVLVDAIG